MIHIYTQYIYICYVYDTHNKYMYTLYVHRMQGEGQNKLTKRFGEAERFAHWTNEVIGLLKSG